MRNNFDQQSGKMEGRLTQEQITAFRQIFSRYMDGEVGGLKLDHFSPAVLECLRQTSNSAAPSERDLEEQFTRLSGGSGLVRWPQFFQVIIHLQSVAGATGGAEAIDLEPSAPPIPDPQRAVPSLGRTLRRGGAAFGRAVGNFFGVTDESQHGSAHNVGWQAVTERREEAGGGFLHTLGRRPSQRVPAEPPPDYGGLGFEAVGGAVGRSFDPTQLEDDEDEEEEDVFMAQAPPDYSSVVQEEGSSGVRFRGGEDIRVSVIPDLPPDIPRELLLDADIPPELLQQEGYPVPTQAQLAQEPLVDQQREGFLYNPNQAMEYYLKFVKAEKRLRHRRHHDYAVEFFGGDGSAAGGGGVSRSGTVRRGRIEPQGVQRRGRRPKRTKLQRQSTLIRREVETLPTFWPIFTILVTLAQLVVMVTLLALMGFAPINYQSIEHMEEFKSLNITGGNRTELVTYYRSSNLWIGPTPRVLVEVGAKFSPCMRNDFHIRRRNAEARDDFEQKNFGCCRNSENIGTTVTSQCGVINGNAPPDVESLDDFAFIPQTLCSNASVVPNFHPCCISLTGRCEVMNIFQCDARNGIFHEELDSCFEVNCLEDICGFRGAYVSSDENMIYSANQFWRWFLAIFTHLGIIHFILVMAIQLYAGIKIERTIGWLRITLIYVISGVGGNILSAVFAPYEVNAGASGAVFGLLGVLYVELFQFWQIKDRAWLELIVLTAFVLLLLGVGTLPYVDNWAHIGGFIYGVPAAVIFVPYITFGTWDSYRKRIALLISIPLLLALLAGGFMAFYLIQDPSFCPACQYINCVPYAPGLCPEEYSDPNPQVFSL